MATKTYYVTATSGQVRRMDNLTGPWIDVSVPGATAEFLDVMTFPSSEDNVIVVGRDGQIYKSIDAGVNWIAATGNYTGLLIDDFFEVWILDSLNSYVVGNNGVVVKSTDGGLTYNSTLTFPTALGTSDANVFCTSVHFVTSQIGVVGLNNVGVGAEVWKTIDGGDTWTQLNSAASLSNNNTDQPLGIFISNDEQSIVVLMDKNHVWKSFNSGNTFIQTLSVGDTPLRHLTWLQSNSNIMFACGDTDILQASADNGTGWTPIRPATPGNSDMLGAHFYDIANGFIGSGSTLDSIYTTTTSGLITVLSETVASVNAVWTERSFDPCYRLLSCDTDVYPNIDQVKDGVGIDLSSVIGNIISTNDPLGDPRCYTVELQEDIPCNEVPDLLVSSYTLVGNSCGEFLISSVCPAAFPFTLAGESSTIEVEITNTSENIHDFSFSLGSCTSTEVSILTISPISILPGETGIVELSYNPIIGEEGTCELIVTGPCGELTCNICYRSVAVPSCPHFNICITGPTCAPDCIKPGEVVRFDLGGSISAIAYPTIITFSVIEQATQQVVFSADYPVNDDTELDAITINVVAGAPGKYCAQVCIPGCNTKRILCFDVCEEFDIYKDSCNHWHVHRPHQCVLEEYTVSVTELGGNVIIPDTSWDLLQDNTFEFEVPNDGIFIFEMKDPATGEVRYSFAAFETCGIQECFKVLMDKIMCSCSDPCCKKCDGTPKEHREFARMTLNMLMPLYFTYLGMARRNELYTVGMKLISDDQMCFLHDASQILDKIRDIIMDCGCLCPEQKNTATNRGDCQSC